MTFGPDYNAPKIRDFEVFDLEWIPNKMNLRLAGAFDGKRYRGYRTINDYLNYALVPEKHDKWFYAHNGGKADLMFIIQLLMDRGYHIDDGAYVSGGLIYAEVVKDQHRWHFLDSLALFHSSLAKLAEAIGMQKGGEDYACPTYKEPVAYSPEVLNAYGEATGTSSPCGHHEYGRKKMCIYYAPDPILRQYNEMDCRILYAGLSKFQKHLLGLGGQLQRTTASCAMALFRRRYMQREIQTFEGHNEIAYESYFASRVEVIRATSSHGKVYDINSSFPFAMTKPCPGSYEKTLTGRLPKGDKLYIADVKITVPKGTYLPPMPYRMKAHGEHGVYFPTGTWRSQFTHVDVELLEDVGGRIEKVYDVLLFEPFDDLARYAQEIYNLRLACKTPMEKQFYKLLLNALYGKFGEDPDKEQILFNPQRPLICTHKPKHRNMPMPPHYPECVTHLAAGVYSQTKTLPLHHRHVPISATITANARRALYDYLRVAIEPAYCDTDSVMCLGELPTSDKLGGLKFEQDYEDGTFVRPKLYRLDKKVRAKGFSEMNVARFEYLRQGGELEIERMMRVKESLAKFGRIVPADVKVTKRIRNITRPKRILDADGNTHAWDLKELSEKYRP